jgi:hypothetical protein
MQLSHFVGMLAVCLLAASQALPQTTKDKAHGVPVVSSPANPDAAAAAFGQVANVIRHPRCMNCHTVTEFPRQGDDRHRHQQLVLRGHMNNGVGAMKCMSCHQAQNSADGKVPGAPHWSLAPLSMGWEHLKGDKALCEAIKDKSKNGDRSVEQLVHHLTADPLVQWAWAPGDRHPPPISQSEFHRFAREWAKHGAACPKD